MYLVEGRTMDEIGRRFGVSHASISKDLAVAKKEWQRARHGIIDDTVRAGLKALQYAMHEAVAAWQASKNNKATVTETESDVTTPGSGKKRQVKVEDANGNPAYLQAIIDSVMAQGKLLGIIPQRETNVSFNGPTLLTWDALTQAIAQASEEPPAGDVIEAKVVEGLPAPQANGHVEENGHKNGSG